VPLILPGHTHYADVPAVVHVIARSGTNNEGTTMWKCWLVRESAELSSRMPHTTYLGTSVVIRLFVPCLH
jgi:hypothetical protein